MDSFIDYLTVHQNHPKGGLPIVSTTVSEVYDPETGEHLKTKTDIKQIEGSFSSSINVNCNGSKVFIEGNPSRFNRADNLFGFTTFDECIRVYNLILLELGLPPFTKNTGFDSYQGRDGKTANFVPNGAVFTRIDITENLIVGRGNEDAFIRGLSTQTMGKGIEPHLFPNGKTVQWKTGLWLVKNYDKGYLIEKLLKKERKKLSEDHVTYLETLVAYCREEGIVRNEKEFKSDFLKRKNLHLYGKIDENDFINHLTDIDKLLERIDMSTSDYTTIAEQLLEVGAVDTERKANTTSDVAFKWLHGSAIKLKKSQLQEHKRRLKSIGIDISIPFDVSKRMPQIKNERVISVKTAAPPHWYRMPKVAVLRAA